jgi:hypothetical protein
MNVVSGDDVPWFKIVRGDRNGFSVTPRGGITLGRVHGCDCPP